MKEIWKDIPNCKGHYQASTFGRTKSTARIILRSDGKQCSVRERILKPIVTKTGYLYVNLYIELGKATRRLVHHIVLEAFVGPCPPGMECRHFPDHNPANNRLDNLQWGTHLENMGDQKIHGTLAIGERKNSKLTEKEVKEILQKYGSGEISQAQLSRDYKVDASNISWIVNKKRWKHLQGPQR